MISVRPRTVAARWEREAYYGHRSTRVEAEDYVEPDPGPLELYRSTWPERYLRWDRRRQLWEIRQVNPDSGADERVELVFYYDAPPDPEIRVPRSAGEIAAMIEAKAPELEKCFMPLGYPFVHRRLAERQQFLADGVKKYDRRVAERNRARQRTVLQDVAREQAAALGELRRWLPVLARKHETGEWRPDERTLLVQGGLTR